MRHVDAVVEDRDAGMPDQAAGLREGFIIEGQVEQRGREIGAQRSADLHRADRAAARGAAADGVHQFHERSQEHSSELQSLMRISYAVFCLTKKTKHFTRTIHSDTL